MPSPDERLTEQFLRWAFRGQGIQLWDAPVSPEPAFLPFLGHRLPPEPAIDDGRKPTLLSSLVRRLSARLSGTAPEAAPAEGRISNESPVGKALIGHKKGDLVRASVPRGEVELKIVAVR